MSNLIHRMAKEYNWFVSKYDHKNHNTYAKTRDHCVKYDKYTHSMFIVFISLLCEIGYFQ